MRVWEIAAGDDQAKADLYRQVFQLTALQWASREIGSAVGVSHTTVQQIQKELQKVVVDMPPDEMTERALMQYQSLSEHVQDEMLALLADMQEDYRLRRQGQFKRPDGTTVSNVLPKDIIALMGQINSLTAQRLAVVNKMTGLRLRNQSMAALPDGTTVDPAALMRGDDDITDAEFEKLGEDF